MKTNIVRYVVIFSAVMLMAVSCSSPLSSAPSNVGGVYRSSNFGADWEVLDRAVLEVAKDGKEPEEKKSPLAQSGVTFLKFSPENKARVYAGTVSQGLFYTEDGGDRWKSILTDFIPHSLAIDPTNPDHIFVAGKSGARARALESDDRGKSWTEIYLDSQEKNSARGIAINPGNPNVVVIALLSGHILRSTDGGTSWNVVAKVADNIKRLEWYAQGPLYLLGEKKGVFESKDAGLSFTPLTEMLHEKNLWTKYFNLENVESKSKDKPIDLPPTQVSQYNSMAVSTSDTGPIYLGTNVGIFVSYNRGVDWRFLRMPLLQNSGSAVQAVGFSQKGGEVYASVGNVVYYSDTAGLSWQVQGIATSGIINYILVDTELPQLVLAGVVGEVYK